jgi:hypothetical protein
LVFILVVDDLRIFSDKIGDNIVHHSLSSADAIKFLEENFPMVSEVWLDYDLGGEDTVVPVINWLEEKAHTGKANHICCIRILTSNPVGAQKIAALGRYFYIGNTPTHIALRNC